MAGKDQRTVVVPETFFTALGARLVKDFGPNGAASVLYDTGRRAGRDFVLMAEKYLGESIRHEEEIRALILMFGREYRWADLTVKELDVPGKYAVIDWRNGVGVPSGGSRRPVCHIGRGLLSGAAEVFFDQPCDAIETQCQAMGADHCELIVGASDRVAKVAERLG